MARIDDAVARILGSEVAIGLLERPMPALQAALVGNDDDRALAREAVGRSLTLLKTSGDVLPMPADGDGPILLAGEGANDIGIQSGGWTISWQGEDGATTEGTTIAAGLHERAGRSSSSCSPPASSPTAGHAPLRHSSSSPSGRTPKVWATPRRSGPTERDLTLLPVIRSKVDRHVIVLVSGRPLVVPEVFDAADAVVEAWLPGSEGGGVADALTGARSFEGRTPYTWPMTPA